MKRFFKCFVSIALLLTLFSCNPSAPAPQQKDVAAKTEASDPNRTVITNEEETISKKDAFRFKIILENGTFNINSDGALVKKVEDGLDWEIGKGEQFAEPTKADPSQYKEYVETNLGGLKCYYVEAIYENGRAIGIELEEYGTPTDNKGAIQRITLPGGYITADKGYKVKETYSIEGFKTNLTDYTPVPAIEGKISKTIYAKKGISFSPQSITVALSVGYFKSAIDSEVVKAWFTSSLQEGIKINMIPTTAPSKSVTFTIKGSIAEVGTTTLTMNIPEYDFMSSQAIALDVGTITINVTEYVADKYLPQIDEGSTSYNVDSSLEGAEAWAVLVNPTEKEMTKPSLPNLQMMSEGDKMLLSAKDVEPTSNGPYKIHRPYQPVIIDEDVLLNATSVKEKSVTPIMSTSVARVSHSLNEEETFWVENSQITARLKGMNENVTVADGTTRSILVWADTTLKTSSSVPSDEEYQKIADAFLKKGFNNDIYDVVIDTFGSDIGFYNGRGGDPRVQNFTTSDVDTINILYIDIDGAGEPAPGKTYTAGYYSSADYFIDGSVTDQNGKTIRSNERPMFYMHAYTAGGDYFASSLTTIAHEFQHLVHDQYYNANLDACYTNRAINNSFITETFSTASEILTAKFLRDLTSQSVEGPFYVGYKGNDKGYLDKEDTDYTRATINGRGPLALSVFNSNAGQSVAMNSNSTWNYSLYDYGKDAALAHYLVVNYGREFFKKYTSSKYYKEGIDTINTVLDIIRELKGDSTYSMEQFLKDYGAAMLLSRVNGEDGDISAPYEYNKKGWYNIGGLSVGSVNLWQYKDKVNHIYGFKTYDGPALYPYSVQFAKLSDSVSGGENSLPSTFNPGSVKYQVVIVPKE